MKDRCDTGIDILLVDDIADFLHVMESALSRMCRVQTAESGADALALFKEKKFEILITDIRMPGMSGLELIEKCKQINPGIKVAIASAFEEVDMMHKAIELKVDKYLTKPFGIDVLRETVKELIRLVEDQHQLYIAKQHNSALLNSFIVTKTDQAGRITYANDAFLRISGYDADELLGENHNIVRHPDTPDSVFENLWETIKKKKVWQGVVKDRAKDGHDFVTRSMIFPILDEEGEIIEFMAIRQDITELEKLRLELEAHEKEVEKARDEKRILEEINKIKDSFLVLFTHELKTPLNSIVNFSEYMLKTAPGEKEQKLLGSINRNSKDMVRMVNSILDIAKIKSDKLKLKFANVDIGNVLRERIQVFSRNELENVDMELNCAKDVFLVTDLYRFTQILDNLISNAIKYGKGKVRINCEKRKEIFELSVEDNGGGVRDKERVFELFEQEGDQLHKNEKGTGVGLNLVKMLAGLLGLDVFMEDSKELGGAKVVLRTK